MAYTTLDTVQWGTGPRIPLTFSYDYKRSGADMQYRIKIVVGGISGESYFGYPIYSAIALDGSTKVSEYTIKGISPSQWSSGAYTQETDWITVSGKTSGTTSLAIRVYSGLGSSRDSTYNYSLYVSPSVTTPSLSTSSADMGGKVTISLPRASSAFTHKLWYQTSGGSWLAIADNVATSYTWTVPDLASLIPNATSLQVEIKAETYEGTSKIGEKTVSMTATVPASVVPVISSVTIAEATAGLAAKFGVYVQRKSTLSVKIAASGAGGSTIAKYETTIQGAVYREASFTSAVLSSAGTISIATTVTDSRGRTAKTSKSVAVVEYDAPKINSFSVWRITTAGAASDDGNRVAVKMNYTVASVGGKNDRTYNLKYRKSTDSSFASFGSGTADTSYDGTKSFTSAPDVSVDYAYTIRLEIADYFQTVAYEVQIPTAFTILDFRNTGKGFAVGKVSEKDAFEVALPVDVTKDVTLSGNATISGNVVRRGSEQVATSTSASGTGQNGYIKVAQIVIKTLYTSTPMTFTLVQREMRLPYQVCVKFVIANTVDPELETIVRTPTSPVATHVYIVKSATSTWDMWVKKTYEWDIISILDVRQEAIFFQNEITYPFTFATALPSGATEATEYLNATRLGGYGLWDNTTNEWEKVPLVRGDGVVNVGRYIDFHRSSGDTQPCHRLWSYGDNGPLRLDTFDGSSRFLDAYIDWSNVQNVTIGIKEIFKGSTSGAISFTFVDYQWILVEGKVASNDSMSSTVCYSYGAHLFSDESAWYAFNLYESGISACTGGSGVITRVLGLKI